MNENPDTLKNATRQTGDCDKLTTQRPSVQECYRLLYSLLRFELGRFRFEDRERRILDLTIEKSIYLGRDSIPIQKYDDFGMLRGIRRDHVQRTLDKLKLKNVIEGSLNDGWYRIQPDSDLWIVKPWYEITREIRILNGWFDKPQWEPYFPEPPTLKDVLRELYLEGKGLAKAHALTSVQNSPAPADTRYPLGSGVRTDHEDVAWSAQREPESAKPLHRDLNLVEGWPNGGAVAETAAPLLGKHDVHTPAPEGMKALSDAERADYARQCALIRESIGKGFVPSEGTDLKSDSAKASPGDASLYPQRVQDSREKPGSGPVRTRDGYEAPGNQPAVVPAAGTPPGPNVRAREQGNGVPVPVAVPVNPPVQNRFVPVKQVKKRVPIEVWKREATETENRILMRIADAVTMQDVVQWRSDWLNTWVRQFEPDVIERAVRDTIDYSKGPEPFITSASAYLKHRIREFSGLFSLKPKA